MAGYLSESDFVMVEEGFSTRDLLEELTLGASQATTVRVKGWEWGVAGFPVLSSGRNLLIWVLDIYETGYFYPQFLVLASTSALPVFPALRKEHHCHMRGLPSGNLRVPISCSLRSYIQTPPSSVKSTILGLLELSESSSF